MSHREVEINTEKNIDDLINENMKLKSLLSYVYSVVQSVKSNNPNNAMMGLDIIDNKMDKDYDVINDLTGGV
ncbi:MAG: hypothetical protein QGG95_07475 [Nitrospinota bacterium]|jgi:hypothetical protein|nr:hypothetical protein [Nitrospinota bacterium]|tara:strand:- start:464 stop:679 length:216 start_codon:yes stop_codon:yes gene_type:complete